MRKSIFLPLAFAAIVTSPVATTPVMAWDPCTRAQADYNRAWAEYKRSALSSCFMKNGTLYCRNYAQYQRLSSILYGAMAQVRRVCRD